MLVSASCAAPNQGKIVFASDRDGDRSTLEIYIMNEDGSEQTRLTNNLIDDAFPVASPDGKRIAYYSETEPQVGLYVIDVDGSNSVRVTEDEYFDTDMSWSPDSKQIAYICYKGQICIAQADGSNVSTITTDATSKHDPKWSPNGKYIAFASSAEPYGIYIVNVDGSDLRPLTPTEIGGHYPNWSPDSSQIVFNAGTAGDSGIYVVNVDSTELTRITYSAPFDNLLPVWSPDGQRIVFLSSRSGNGMGIFVMSADGNDPTLITDDGIDEDQFLTTWAPWSPDSGKIVFQANHQVCMMSAMGGKVSCPTVGKMGGNIMPSWVP